MCGVCVCGAGGGGGGGGGEIQWRLRCDKQGSVPNSWTGMAVRRRLTVRISILKGLEDSYAVVV